MLGSVASFATVPALGCPEFMVGSYPSLANQPSSLATLSNLGSRPKLDPYMKGGGDGGGTITK